MLKNFGFFALGIVVAALGIYAMKKMYKPTTTETTEENASGSDGGMGSGTNTSTSNSSGGMS